jgi:hypothetical protein
MKRLIKKSNFDINSIKNLELKEMLENNNYDDGQSHRSEAGIYIDNQIYTGMIHTDAIMKYIAENPNDEDVRELIDDDNVDEYILRDEIGDGRNLDMSLSFFDICDSDDNSIIYIIYFEESAGPINKVYDACKKQYGNILMFIVYSDNTLSLYK